MATIKIAARPTEVVKSAASVDWLSAGDRIALKVSSQVVVNGDENWVTMEVSSAVRDHESADAACERVLTYLSQKFEQSVERLVEKITAMGA